jgi:carbon-monoxide dehydrogenase small subunit
VRIKLTVNGDEREAEAADHESLLTVLRDNLGLPGSKNACEQGECGSCSVVMDGDLVCACLVLGAAAAGRNIQTVESVSYTI